MLSINKYIQTGIVLLSLMVTTYQVVATPSVTMKSGRYYFYIDNKLLLKNDGTAVYKTSIHTAQALGVNLSYECDCEVVIDQPKITITTTNVIEEPEVLVNDDGNFLPIVSFTQPETSESNSNVGVVVEASDPDGTIESVELYINDELVRVERMAPYEWGTANPDSQDDKLSNLSDGQYELRAVAIDNLGSSKSTVISIIVSNPPSEETPQLGSATLKWSIPTKRLDGSSLLESEIKEYIIIVDMPDGTTKRIVLDGSVYEYKAIDLSQGIHRFKIATVDTNGLIGDFSEVVIKEIL